VRGRVARHATPSAARKPAATAPARPAGPTCPAPAAKRAALPRTPRGRAAEPNVMPPSGPAPSPTPPPQFSGKILELANQHTASRVIQFCLKEGPPEARAAVAAELRAHAVELAKSKYGHYLVVKLINVAPKEDVPGGWRRLAARARARARAAAAARRGGVLAGARARINGRAGPPGARGEH
jgi:hypothetical protein